MIHCCHITTVHPEKDNRIFYKECKSLSCAGYEVNLLVVNGESFEEDGVKVIGIPCKYSSRLQRFRKASRVVYNKALSLDADIYHFHDPEFLPYAAKLVKKGKKVIYDVHEDLPRQILSKHYIPAAMRRIIATIVNAFENRYSRKMSYIITATPYIRDRFLKLNKNTSEVQNFPQTGNELPPEPKKKSDAACYIGIITKIRGLTEVVKSLDSTDAGLVLVGNFEPENYQQELSGLSGWKKVNYIGYADRKKAMQILNSSFAGIVTFHPESNHIHSQPNKLFEYMSAGLPLIASDFPLWKEIINANQCGLCVDPLDSDNIARGINFLHKHPEEARKMGLNGRKAVLEKYNWAKEEPKLLAVYKSLFNG